MDSSFLHKFTPLRHHGSRYYDHDHLFLSITQEKYDQSYGVFSEQASEFCRFCHFVVLLVEHKCSTLLSHHEISKFLVMRLQYVLPANESFSLLIPMIPFRRAHLLDLV